MITAEKGAFRSPQEKYETYAEVETALGNDAWADGQYHRAIKLWKSAARWSQFAAKATVGGETR